MKKDRYGIRIQENEHAYELALQDMEQLIFSVTIFQAKNGQVRIAMSGELTNEQSSIVANAVLSCLEGFGIIAVPVGKEEVS